MQYSPLRTKSHQFLCIDPSRPSHKSPFLAFFSGSCQLFLLWSMLLLILVHSMEASSAATTSSRYKNNHNNNNNYKPHIVVPRVASWLPSVLPQRSTFLVLGATGATGRFVVQKLLEQGHSVKVIVRSKERLVEALSSLSSSSSDTHFPHLFVTEASLLDLSAMELQKQVEDVQAVICCLGHNLNLKGIWGPPYRLVTLAVQRLTHAMEMVTAESSSSNPTTSTTTMSSNSRTRCDNPKKFVLMGSDGVADPTNDDIRPFSERMVLTLIRWLIPPHRDNEMAAAFLRNHYPRTIPQQQQQTQGASFDHSHHHSLEWVVVRPTDLVDETTIITKKNNRKPDDANYILHPQPVSSLFGGNVVVARSHVAQCMVHFITQPPLWRAWKFQMPVVHNMLPSCPTRSPTIGNRRAETI